jgi:3'-5' exonuclease
MSANGVGFLVFDIEAVADGDLVSKLRYPDAGLAPRDAIAKFRHELREQTGRDVVPPTFMLPIAVAVAKVSPTFRLIDVAVLDEPKFRPHVIARGFWQGWRHYGRPPLVTFNGRGYDLPVLEFAAYRYGYALPDWFNVDAKSFEQARNRYNSAAHIDLMELFSNFGALRMSGGLNLMAHLIGKPGKTGLDGSQIQDLYDAGEVQQINDYCRCDALDTYFVFLRSRVVLGKVTLEEEQAIVDEAKSWIELKAQERPAFAHYLEHWGDWKPPAD